jgi:hypothetical protein
MAVVGEKQMAIDMQDALEELIGLAWSCGFR